jgi:hypothetical protein
MIFLGSSNQLIEKRRFQVSAMKTNISTGGHPCDTQKISQPERVNPEAWICPFSFSIHPFSGFQFDTRFPDTIWSMYPNYIPTQKGNFGNQDSPIFSYKSLFFINSI